MRILAQAAIVVGAIWSVIYLFGPVSVRAQSDARDLFIEPGTTLIRDPDTGVQVQGKIVIDRRSGEVWGFPTASKCTLSGCA
jgi:hypothetical protein